MAWHGLKCPNCNLTDDFRVEFIGECKLTKDGSVDDGNHEWDDESRIWCGCGWSGTVGDCRTKDMRARRNREKAARKQARQAFADSLSLVHQQSMKAANGTVFHLYAWPLYIAGTNANCTVLFVEAADGRLTHFIQADGIAIETVRQQLRVMAAAKETISERLSS